MLTSLANIPLYCQQKSRDPSHILTNATMKKFGGPGPGPYEKNTGIGEIPAAGPCDVKGLIFDVELVKIV